MAMTHMSDDELLASLGYKQGEYHFGYTPHTPADE